MLDESISLINFHSLDMVFYLRFTSSQHLYILIESEKDGFNHMLKEKHVSRLFLC